MCGLKPYKHLNCIVLGVILRKIYLFLWKIVTGEVSYGWITSHNYNFLIFNFYFMFNYNPAFYSVQVVIMLIYFVYTALVISMLRSVPKREVLHFFCNFLKRKFSVVAISDSRMHITWLLVIWSADFPLCGHPVIINTIAYCKINFDGLMQRFHTRNICHFCSQESDNYFSKL